MTAPRGRHRAAVASRKRGARKLRDVWRCAARFVKVRARILFKAIGYYTLSGTPRGFVDLYDGSTAVPIRCYVDGDENNELLTIA
eukprot:11021009-Prorocentrum_lima.AAC.1